ncbi:retinol dehydrogenase 13-like [Anoplophora glabripennis]|uniref:retinol dehydrogenase 13-like n=1 Tax=Anoplophora glabripennis TaxID=217634 RepID=UPI000875A026|nr:retinol dehydrogenase 13-like [Anoplophora glabripennis]
MQDFLKDFEIFSQSWWPYIITLFVTIISAIRIYIGGTYCDSSHQIVGKNVIITGGASGIGFETAKELAKRGGNIILAVRNAEKGRRAIERIKMLTPKANVVIKLLDVSEFSSIRDFADQIIKEYNRIDVLINNAGIIFHPYKKTSDGNELTFVTNYLGPFLLTHLLLSVLNNSDNGRVINVSALAHFNGKLKLDDFNSEKNFNEKEAFSQSKLALTMFTKYMAQLYKSTKITFNAVDPGLVRGTGHIEKYSTLGRSLITKISVLPWVWLFLKTPKQGCQSIVYLAVDPTLNNVSGYYFSNCEIREPSEIVKDVNLSKLLYDKSCRIVNIDKDKFLINREISDAPVNNFEN